MKKIIAKNILFLLSLSGLMFLYSNCGGFKSITGALNRIDNASTGNNGPTGVFGNGEVVGLVGAVTYGVPHFGQIFESAKNVTCISNPPASLIAENQNLGALYSQTGLANSMSESVQVVTMRITSQFCEEAYNREAAMAAAQRCVYKSVNYQAGPEQFTTANVQSMVQDMAKQFWHKSANADELSVMTNGILGISNASTASGDAKRRDVAVAACTLALNVINGLAQ